MLSNHAETEGKKKGGRDLFSSPSSQRQIIQQLIHSDTNNEMSMTSISLLDCTHLYEEFAVRERYHSAFTMTYLVYVAEVSVLAAPSSAPW